MLATGMRTVPLRQRALPAKLTRPQAQAVLARERVFVMLDEPGATRGVWVGAPAGAGKTTLASSWVEARGLRAIWYQVDAGDADPATAFHYLAQAAQALPGGRRARFTPLTPEYVPGLDVFARRFFEQLCGLIADPFVVVFDNCQEAPAESPFHRVLLPALLDSLPGQGELLCLSRESPPAALARWSADPAFRVVSGDDLALSDEEAARFVRLSGAASTVAVSALNRYARGWITGLKLLLRASASGRVTPGQPPAVLRPQPLFDYLAEEVFERASPERQRFLMICALLPQMSAAASAALTGAPDAERMLELMYTERAFIERRDLPDRVSYQFHPLFRDFLLGHAARALASHEMTALKARAAALLAQEGELESAAALAIEGQDWPLLRGFILEHAAALLAQGRSALLEAWCVALPEAERAADDGWLHYWLGVSRMYRDPPLGRASLETAAARFRAAGHVEGAFLALASVIESHFLAWGDAPIDGVVAEFEALLDQNGGTMPAAVESRVLATVGEFVSHVPDHRLSNHFLERAQVLAPLAEEARERNAISCLALAYFTWQGDQVSAWRIMDDLLRRPGRGQAEWSGLLVAIWHGVLLWTASEHERADAVLRQALEEAKRTGLQLAGPHILAQVALNAMSAGDHATAAWAMDEFFRCILPFQVVFHRLGRGVRALQLVLGDQVVMGAAVARELAAVSTDLGAPSTMAMDQCFLGIAFLEAGSLGESAAALERALDYARHMPSDRWMFEALMLQAGVALERSAEEAVRLALTQALRIGARRGFTGGVSLFQPRRTARLLALALRESIEPDYVRQLILRRKLVPPPGSSEAQWPWRLSIRTLGGFEVLAGGQRSLKLTARAPRKPFDVLKALVALGPGDVSLTSLTAQLWPELDGDAAHNACHVALHRLRRLVGEDGVITVDQGKAALNPGLAWTDTQAFRALVERIDRHLAPGNAAAELPRTEVLAGELLAAYPGHFLPEEEAVWVLGVREQLRSRFLRAAMGLANALQLGGAYEAAVDLHRRGIEVDPLVEGFHAGLMRALHALGRTAEAIGTYRRCREILAGTLGVEPSPETLGLYRRITTA